MLHCGPTLSWQAKSKSRVHKDIPSLRTFKEIYLSDILKMVMLAGTDDHLTYG